MKVKYSKYMKYTNFSSFKLSLNYTTAKKVHVAFPMTTDSSQSYNFKKNLICFSRTGK